MPSEIAALYRASKKKQDINWFTEWIARPPAAVVVYAIRNTPLTPNQVTFGSAIVAAGACAMFALCPGWLWLVVAALIFEFSFVLDCADGMLARLRKIASPIGHQLDFLMDELKAMLLFGCVTVRMWRDTGDERLLVIGIFALFALASGIALTSFMRRAEYGGGAAITEDGQPAQVGKRGGPIGLALNTFEWAARVVVHYPQYLWLVAAVNRIDIYFWAYAGVNVLYFGMSMLKILLKLGRFAK
jgi:phosphatidylglycerophosphate synthase